MATPNTKFEGKSLLETCLGISSPGFLVFAMDDEENQLLWTCGSCRVWQFVAVALIEWKEEGVLRLSNSEGSVPWERTNFASFFVQVGPMSGYQSSP